MNTDQHFAKIVDEFRAEKGVILPSSEPEGRKSFGSNGLRIHGKIFAMLSSNNNFVIKLPRERVNALISAGDGEPFDPRRNGRVMKEWIVLKSSSQTNWLQLAREAMKFVSRS